MLLDGMKRWGELFGSGRTADALRAPVRGDDEVGRVTHPRTLMEKTEGAEKGTMVLATVKGDVHDIGKNLVDIILTTTATRW